MLSKRSETIHLEIFLFVICTYIGVKFYFLLKIFSASPSISPIFPWESRLPAVLMIKFNKNVLSAGELPMLIVSNPAI